MVAMLVAAFVISRAQETKPSVKHEAAGMT
jgi:hypothetical protein